MNGGSGKIDSHFIQKEITQETVAGFSPFFHEIGVGKKWPVFRMKNGGQDAVGEGRMEIREWKVSVEKRNTSGKKTTSCDQRKMTKLCGNVREDQ